MQSRKKSLRELSSDLTQPYNLSGNWGISVGGNIVLLATSQMNALVTKGIGTHGRPER